MVEIGPEEADVSVDAGLTSLAAIGDRVWQDQDADGVQDADERALSGVGVELLDAGGAVMAVGASGPRGDYLFTGLAPGEYRVRFSLDRQDGAIFTRPDRGDDDELDSDADQTTGETPTVTVAAGQVDGSVDAGVVLFGTSASIAGVVWHDADGDGIRELGESKAEGVDVTLLDAAGAELATTQTSAIGRYEFRALEAGGYRVRFTSPAGFGFTQPDPGEDEQLDSDADPATGESPLITVEQGERESSVGAGLVPGPASGTAAIGDRVWRDRNGNGIQDPDEGGLAGVTVTLVAENGAVLATTVTDGDGLYEFSNLDAGSYRVRADPPPSFTVSPRDAGPDDVDSDIDPATHESGLVTVAAGETDDTVDAGLFQS